MRGVTLAVIQLRQRQQGVRGARLQSHGLKVVADGLGLASLPCVGFSAAQVCGHRVGTQGDGAAVRLNRPVGIAAREGSIADGHELSKLLAPVEVLDRKCRRHGQADQSSRGQGKFHRHHLTEEIPVCACPCEGTDFARRGLNRQTGVPFRGGDREIHPSVSVAGISGNLLTS
jgi:hypothetical protein